MGMSRNQAHLLGLQSLGFPNIRGTFFRVPLLWVVIRAGLYLGPPLHGETIMYFGRHVPAGQYIYLRRTPLACNSGIIGI